MPTRTFERARLNTDDQIDSELHRQTERRIAFYAMHPELIESRLRELDEEWDIERLIETEAPMVTLFGLLMGAVFGRKWLILPLLAQSMVLMHAVQGYYPLLSLFRRMGFRSETEIAAERYALKAIRGDFKALSEGQASGDGRRRAEP